MPTEPATLLRKTVSALEKFPSLNVDVSIHLSDRDPVAEVLSAMYETFGDPSGPEGPYGNSYAFEFGGSDDVTVFVPRSALEENPVAPARIRSFAEVAKLEEVVDA